MFDSPRGPAVIPIRRRNYTPVLYTNVTSLYTSHVNCFFYVEREESAQWKLRAEDTVFLTLCNGGKKRSLARPRSLQFGKISLIARFNIYLRYDRTNCAVENEYLYWRNNIAAKVVEISYRNERFFHFI